MINDLPFVSCICPTYGRPPHYQHLLEEAIESFLRQDYPGPKELIILNDCPGQVLRLAEPPRAPTTTTTCQPPGPIGSGYLSEGLAYENRVRTLNWTNRFATLGQKYNRACSFAYGWLILPWEDDDISLPGRISQAVERTKPISRYKGTITTPAPYLPAYWNPQRTFFADARGIHTNHSHGVCHNASVFTQVAWQMIGGYPPISGAQDAAMDGALKSLGQVADPLPDDPATWQYIYRWGVSDCHLSGVAPHDDFYRQVGTRPVQPGTFVLRPHWRQDYVALAAGASQRHTVAGVA